MFNMNSYMGLNNIDFAITLMLIGTFSWLLFAYFNKTVGIMCFMFSYIFGFELAIILKNWHTEITYVIVTNCIMVIMYYFEELKKHLNKLS